MTQTRAFIIATTAFLSLGLQAATYYVDAARPDDSGAGTSWATAKQTIQAAVDASVDGDTVLVTNGVYNIGAKPAPGYNVNNRVMINNKALTVRSLNGAAGTVIEGSGTSRFGTADAIRCVYMASSYGHSPSLEGFTLRYGATFSASQTNSGFNGRGGGIYALNTIDNHIRDCVIENCIANEAGGVFGGALERCRIRYNRAISSAGGVWNGAIRSSIIYANEAKYAAGASFNTLRGCTVVGNKSDYGSGASNCNFMNCIIWGNVRNGIVDNYTSSPSGTFSYTCTTPMPTIGSGNIAADPLFLTNVAGDYRLQTNSPCRNTGTNSWATEAWDILWSPRIQEGVVDMGAFEYPVPTNGPSLLYYADASRPDDSGDGLSWATAKKTIQAAVDLAVPGSTVLVTNGIYNSGTTVTPNGTLNNRVLIDKMITVRSVNGAASTFIEGSGTSSFGTDSAVRCVYMRNNAKLEGFTLRYGATQAYASGLYADAFAGGGIYATGTYCEIRACVIRECMAALGGGACLGTFYNCTFTQNRATNGGGGTDTSTLYSCVLFSNEAGFAGGSYYGTRVNCTIVNNRSTSGTAGVGYGNTYNSVIWGNTRNGVVDNYFLSTSGWVIAYTCTTPLPSGTGNIASDPQFLTSTEGDYRLHARSPCLNVGSNGYVIGSTDYLGRTRIQSGTVDLGAFEGAYRWPQTLTFPQLPDRTYGDGPVTLSATASSGLSVMYATGSPSVITNMSGTIVKIIGAGIARVFAIQSGNTDYDSGTATNAFTVNKATLTARAIDVARTYGSTNYGFTNTYSGFVNGESASVIDTRPTASTTANPFSLVGDYPIKPSGGADNNYTFLYQNGTLSVMPRPLLVKASSRVKTYGAALDLGTQAFTTSGLITNVGDSVSGVVLSSDGASAAANVGNYPIRVSDASGNRLSNYAISYTNGTLTVGSAPLTVTAQDQFKPYGTAFAFNGTEFTASGLQNNATVTSVTLASAGAATDTGVGTYAITPSDALGSGLSNYTISYVNGTFHVGIPAVTFSPPDGTRFTNTVAVTITCPAPNISIRYTLDGSEPDDDSALYTNALSLSATATVCARACAAGAAPGPTAEATFTCFHSLSVSNGTAAGSATGCYEAGTLMTLAAHPAPPGKIFGWWSTAPAGADLGDQFVSHSRNTTFTMPAQALSLAAVYVPNPGRAVGYADVRLTDAATGLPLDDAQWSTDGSTWYPQGVCPLKPSLFSFSFRSADRHWGAPARQQVRVTAGNVTRVEAAFTRVPLVSCSTTGHGTVTLIPASGQVLPGKNVTLKATPARGQVFVQWSDGVRNPSRTVAPDVDTLYTAEFRAPNDPIYTSAPPTLTVAGSDSGIVGVKFLFAQVNPSPLPAQFSATGLPPGLSIDRTTGVISGRPLSAGTFTATFTAAGPAGLQGTATRAFSIAPLPAAAYGTFSGVLFDGENAVRGALTLNVSARGMSSAMATVQSATYRFAGDGWDSESNGVFAVVLRTSTGESLALTLDTGLGLWGLCLRGNLSGGALLDRTLEIRGQRNAFGDKGSPEHAVVAKVLAGYEGYYTVALPVADASAAGAASNIPQGCGYLTLTVKDDGGVTLCGKAADGTALSGSTTLMVCDAGTPDEFAYVPLFLPLYGKLGLLAGLLAIDPEATPAPTDNTVAPVSGDAAPIEWTYPGKAPAANPPQTEDRFRLDLGASGGFCDTRLNRSFLIDICP